MSLSKDDLSRIYHEMSEEDSDILKILANTGIRWGELRHLEWQNIDLNQRVISIGPKGDLVAEGWGRKANSDK